MIETDVLIVGSGPAGSSSALFLSTYGVQNMVITKYRWTANTPRAHITNQRAVEIMRDMGLEDEIKAKGVPQPPDGRHGVLHQPGGRRARPPAHLGHAPAAAGRLHARQPVHPLRPAAGHLRADHPRRGRAPRQPRALRHRVPLARPGRRRRHGHGAGPHRRRGLRDPRQVPDRRRRRALEDRAGHRPADGGRDGLGGVDEHRLPRGPLQVRRAPPERPLLDHAAGRRHGWHRHGPGAHGAPVGRVADRLGLRHQRAAAGGRRGGRDPRRAQPRGRRHDRRHAAQHLAVGQQQDVRQALRRGPRVLHGRRLPPAPAEQRPGLEHVDRRRVQPGLEARAGARRQGRAVAAGLLRRRARADRPSRSSCARTRASRSSGRSSTRSACSTRPTRADAGQHGDPQGELAARRRGAREAQGRDRAQELRVQRARRRARAPLPLRRGGRRTARPSRSSRATRSSTTTRRPGPARGCRTRGSSTRARRSRRTTSPARGASRSSPGSAARAGWRPRRT